MPARLVETGIGIADEHGSQHDKSMRAYGAMPTLPVIDERHLARAIVDEEIERIDRVDLDRELDQHVELGDRLPSLERDARDAIAVRIAQPVQAMLRLDRQLIALDPRARVIGRPQPDQLRA